MNQKLSLIMCLLKGDNNSKTVSFKGESVSDEKVADESVSDVKVVDESVSDEKVADESVSDEKVADESVSDEKVVDSDETDFKDCEDDTIENVSNSSSNDSFEKLEEKDGY
jgi:hypothetical protein